MVLIAVLIKVLNQNYLQFLMTLFCHLNYLIVKELK